jgi:plasmid maintenance system antidote protein VapI
VSRKKPKPKSPEEIALRARIAAWMRVAFEEFCSDFPESSQKDFAEKLDMDPGTVSRVLRDEAEAGLDTMLAIHLVFGTSPSALMKQDPAKKYFEGMKVDGRKRRYARLRGASDAEPPFPRHAVARHGSSR